MPTPMLHGKIDAFILLLCSALVVACGTNPVPAPKRPTGGVWEIRIFQDQDQFPPITASHVWMDDEVAFLIVPTFERAGGGGGSGSGGLPYKAWFHGEIYLPDGKTEVSFRAESSEGGMDSVTIADTSYDLEEGRLFFVSLVDGGFDVTQVDQDTRTLTPQSEDPKELEAFLRNVPEFEKLMSSAQEQR